MNYQSIKNISHKKYKDYDIHVIQLLRVGYSFIRSGYNGKVYWASLGKSPEVKK